MRLHDDQLVSIIEASTTQALSNGFEEHTGGSVLAARIVSWPYALCVITLVVSLQLCEPIWARIGQHPYNAVSNIAHTVTGTDAKSGR